MIKLTFLITLLSFFFANSFSQTDSISVEKVFGGFKFEQNDKRIFPNTMLIIMADNQEALSFMKKAKLNYGFSFVLSFTGGFLLGWPIGTAIGGGEPNWNLAGIGTGLMVAGIPFSRAGDLYSLKAIEIYNSNIQAPTSRNGIRLDIGLTNHGIGMTLTF